MIVIAEASADRSRPFENLVPIVDLLVRLETGWCIVKASSASRVLDLWLDGRHAQDRARPGWVS
jgi:hypothetical protein